MISTLTTHPSIMHTHTVGFAVGIIVGTSVGILFFSILAVGLLLFVYFRFVNKPRTSESFDMDLQGSADVKKVNIEE